MIETELLTKPLPNNKRQLLEGRNYEMYNLDLLRKVFPRIIAEHNAAFGRKQNKPQIRDIIALYFYLLSYVDGTHTRADGSPSDRFGASFPAVTTIASDLGIAQKRIKPLSDILEANGLIRQKQVWNGKWYIVSFCPRISDDGYIVNEDGEKVVPDSSIYLRDRH
ncbi:hypothetical protein PZE06_18835 [Robertmurraya sp. DFI.2.37]|uniref:hypothetical protein n=1 Tax=Robertmurraya sp. DFI.2.37 TaxID=3031819 RepID=UPI0023D9EE1F|nr:hypothetical protein [Robertmurraya sp. DFI.2.37]MDF1510194.1 hypothetical protein [Robertmurraya sp. DFI.2.37]